MTFNTHHTLQFARPLGSQEVIIGDWVIPDWPFGLDKHERATLEQTTKIIERYGFNTKDFETLQKKIDSWYARFYHNNLDGTTEQTSRFPTRWIDLLADPDTWINPKIMPTRRNAVTRKVADIPRDSEWDWLPPPLKEIFNSSNDKEFSGDRRIEMVWFDKEGLNIVARNFKEEYASYGEHSIELAQGGKMSLAKWKPILGNDFSKYWTLKKNWKNLRPRTPYWDLVDLGSGTQITSMMMKPEKVRRNAATRKPGKLELGDWWDSLDWEATVKGGTDSQFAGKLRYSRLTAVKMIGEYSFLFRWAHRNKPVRELEIWTKAGDDLIDDFIISWNNAYPDWPIESGLRRRAYPASGGTAGGKYQVIRSVINESQGKNWMTPLAQETWDIIRGDAFLRRNAATRKPAFLALSDFSDVEWVVLPFNNPDYATMGRSHPKQQVLDELFGKLKLSDVDKRCSLCSKQASFEDLNLPVGPRTFCSEKCWANYAGERVEPEGFYGFLSPARNKWLAYGSIEISNGLTALFVKTPNEIRLFGFAYIISEELHAKIKKEELLWARKWVRSIEEIEPQVIKWITRQGLDFVERFDGRYSLIGENAKTASGFELLDVWFGADKSNFHDNYTGRAIRLDILGELAASGNYAFVDTVCPIIEGPGMAQVNADVERLITGSIWPYHSSIFNKAIGVDDPLEVNDDFRVNPLFDVLERYNQQQSRAPRQNPDSTADSTLDATNRALSRNTQRNAKPIKIKIDESTNKAKKLMATFTYKDGKTKTTHFGARGMSDYTQHKDEKRMKNYLNRHDNGKENWNDPTTAGALSRWILWGKPSLRESFNDFKTKFKLEGSMGVRNTAKITRRNAATRKPSRPPVIDWWEQSYGHTIDRQSENSMMIEADLQGILIGNDSLNENTTHFRLLVEVNSGAWRNNNDNYAWYIEVDRNLQNDAGFKKWIESIMPHRDIGLVDTVWHEDFGQEVQVFGPGNNDQNEDKRIFEYAKDACEFGAKRKNAVTRKPSKIKDERPWWEYAQYHYITGSPTLGGYSEKTRVRSGEDVTRIIGYFGPGLIPKLKWNFELDEYDDVNQSSMAIYHKKRSYSNGFEEIFIYDWEIIVSMDIYAQDPFHEWLLSIVPHRNIHMIDSGWDKELNQEVNRFGPISHNYKEDKGLFEYAEMNIMEIRRNAATRKPAAVESNDWYDEFNWEEGDLPSELVAEKDGLRFEWRFAQPDYSSLMSLGYIDDTQFWERTITTGQDYADSIGEQTNAFMQKRTNQREWHLIASAHDSNLPNSNKASYDWRRNNEDWWLVATKIGLSPDPEYFGTDENGVLLERNAATRKPAERKDDSWWGDHDWHRYGDPKPMYSSRLRAAIKIGKWKCWMSWNGIVNAGNRHLQFYKQDDNIMESQMTIAELKELLKAAGKPFGGKKEDLIARLSNWEEVDMPEMQEFVDEWNIRYTDWPLEADFSPHGDPRIRPISLWAGREVSEYINDKWLETWNRSNWPPEV